jgi:hypothetical protein
MIARYQALFGLVLVLAAKPWTTTVSAVETSAPIDIGSRRELFVDDFLIDTLRGTTLKLHEPVLAPPLTGDAVELEYGTVIKESDRFRLYTRARHNSTRDGDAGEYTRYFESTDGTHWTAPDLGLVEAPGTDWKNVILHDPPLCHNFSPMLDAKPGVPASERYKALAGVNDTGLVGFVSADGIHWTKRAPVIPAQVPWDSKWLFDSQNVSFWSESEGRYVCYFRSYDGLRKIARIESEDYLTWTNPKLLDVNTEGEHLYTSQTHPYFNAPHIYIALPTRFYPDRGESTDILFMSARGDAPFERPFHEAYIRPGLDPARWGNRSNYAALNVVPTGPAEMSIYTTPFRRFTLRTDGFVSVHAGAEAGEMVTKALRFSGRELLVNYATSGGGSLRVAMLDGTTGAVLAESMPLVGDAIEQAVNWPAETALAGLAGQVLRLRFTLVDADLFAIQFRE